MKNKLTMLSIFLLVGLVVGAVLILEFNPFNTTNSQHPTMNSSPTTSPSSNSTLPLLTSPPSHQGSDDDSGSDDVILPGLT